MMYTVSQLSVLAALQVNAEVTHTSYKSANSCSCVCATDTVIETQTLLTNHHDTWLATATAIAAACWHILVGSKSCCNLFIHWLALHPAPLLLKCNISWVYICMGVCICFRSNTVIVQLPHLAGMLFLA